MPPPKAPAPGFCGPASEPALRRLAIALQLRGLGGNVIAAYGTREGARWWNG